MQRLEISKNFASLDFRPLLKYTGGILRRKIKKMKCFHKFLFPIFFKAQNNKLIKIIFIGPYITLQYQVYQNFLFIFIANVHVLPRKHQGSKN